MEKNEQFTLIKGRIEMDKSQVNTKLIHEQDKISNVEKKMISTQNMIQQTSQDLEDIMTVCNINMNVKQIREIIRITGKKNQTTRN